MKEMDKIIDLARKNFKKESFTFYNLMDLVSSKLKDCNIDAADLYINLIEDVRFLSIGKQKWRLCESFKFEEIEKIRMTMFGDKDFHDIENDEVISEIFNEFDNKNIINDSDENNELNDENDFINKDNEEDLGIFIDDEDIDISNEIIKLENEEV
ncbi:MAG: hypothetical protein ACRDCG_00745 [Mycoplasmoidaceae bacterium]